MSLRSGGVPSHTTLVYSTGAIIISSVTPVEPTAWNRCRSGFKNGAVFDCPACYGPVTLDAAHTIADDGRVTPAVACATPACGFTDEIRLLDWVPLAKNAA